MKKRVLSLFLALTLCLTLLPTSAFAEGVDGSTTGSGTAIVEDGQMTAAVSPVEDGNPSNDGAVTEVNGQPADPASTGEGEQPNSETDTRTEIWCVSKPDSIGRGYDGTTDGSTISFGTLDFTDGTTTYTLTEGTDFTATKTFDSANAGNRTVTVVVTLIGTAAETYTLKENTFAINGTIQAVAPNLTVTLSSETCTVGEKLFPLVIASGAPEGAAVTCYYTPSTSTIYEEESSFNVEIGENTTIAEAGAYYVFARSAATTNYKAGTSEPVKLEVSEAVTASVTKVDGTETTYSSFADAWTAAIASEGSTLKLLDKVDIGQEENGLSVDSGKFTLDLNGKTLSGNAYRQLIAVSGTADITIQNGKLVNTFSKDQSDINLGNANAVNIAGGKVVLENVEVTSGCGEGGAQTGAVYVYDGSLTVTSGIFTGTIVVVPQSPDAHPALKITSATLHNGIGYLSFGSGEFDYAGVRALFADGSMLFDKDGKYIDITKAEYWVSEDTGEDAATGFFYSEESVVKPHTHTIVNGKCECGYTCNHKNADGSSAIGTDGKCTVCGTQLAAAIGETYYADVKSALDAATDGQTVKLLADGTLPGKATDNTDLDKSLTLDLNGYVLGPNGSLTVKSGAALTVKNAGAENSEEPVKVGLYLTLLVEKGGSFTCTDGKIRYLGLQDAGTGDYSIKLADGESHCTFGSFAQGDTNATIGDLLKATPGMALHADDSGTDAQVARSTLINNGFNYFSFYVGPCSGHQIGEGGTCIYCGASYVASVTTSGGESTNYTSLDDALDAVKDGDTVTLQGDAEVTKAHRLGTSFTLELNGKAATLQSGAQLSICARSTIQDSSDGQGKMVCNDYGTYILNVQGGELTIKSGTFAGKITAPAGGKSKLTIEGGTFTGDLNLGSVSAALSGGTFTRIWCPTSFLDLLAEGYAFYDKDNNLVNAAKIDSNLYNASVGTHQHSFTDGKCDCGYTCPHTSVGADGKCTVCKKQFAASVTVGEEVTYYDALGNALNKAKAGGTLKLLADVTGTTVMISDPFIFDLNGHSVDALSVDAKATIKDSGTTKGRIGKVTVSDDKVPGLTLGSLLEEGYAFKYETGYWADDSHMETSQGLKVTVEEAPIRSVVLDAIGADKKEVPTTMAYGTTGAVTLEASCWINDMNTPTYTWYKLEGAAATAPMDGVNGVKYKLPADLPAGTHTYRVTCTSDHYSKSVDITVNVTPISLAGAEVTVKNPTYNGQKQFPTVTVKLGEKTLTLNTNFNVTAQMQTDAGSYTLTIGGNGNYSGEIKGVTWKIEPMKIELVKFNKNLSKVYDGSAVFDLTSAAKENCVLFYGPNMQEISIPTDSYEVSNVRFVAKDAENNYVESPEVGSKAIAFTVTLKSENYVLQASDVDKPASELTYTQSGGATFTITKEPAPAQTTEVTLYVTNGLAKTYEVDLAALLPKLTMPCEYGDISYTVNADGLNKDYYTNGATVESGKLRLPILANNVDTEGSIGNVTVTVTTTNYEDITLTIPVFARNKLTPDQTGVTVSASDITYGDSLAKSKLTVTGEMKDPNTGAEVKGTFAWKDSAVKPNAGDYEAEWTFTPAAGYEEYATATGKVTVTVNKANPTFTAPTVKALTYTGSEQSLLTAGSTQGGTMQYRLGDSGEFAASIPTGKNAGTYIVYYKVAGDSNHNDTAEQPITLTISPRKLSRFVLGVNSLTKAYDGTASATLDKDEIEFRSSGAIVKLPEDAYDITNARFTMRADGSYQDSPEVGDGKSLSFTVTLKSDNYVFEGDEESKTLDCNIYSGEAESFTITKATAPTAATGSLTITNGLHKTYSLDLSTLLPKLTAPCDYGKITYDKKIETNLGEGAFITLVDGKTGKLTLEVFNRSGTDEGQFGTITVTISTGNYQDITLTINVIAENKIVPQVDGAVTASDITYGQTLADSKITGKMKDGDKEVDGTFTWVNGTDKPNANDSYQATWKFTPNDQEKYAEVTGTVTIKVNKATPTGKPKYTEITTGGKTLADAALTTAGSTLKPNDGKLEWVDDKGNALPNDTRVEANTAYKWRFTPTDTNYTTLTGEVELYHKSSGGDSSGYSYYTIKATAGVGGSISPSGSVSVREGADQTFTITPDKGYAVSNVKIDGKSIGAVKSYTFENVSRIHTIEVIFMKANGNPQTGVFVDVATGSYYEDAVNWATENGIPQGADDTHFSPDGICTRAQIVTFLWRSEKSPAAGTANPFADVKSTAYYADAVLWAVKENITKGTTNTTFSPDADCTRSQIVTFLWRCRK